MMDDSRGRARAHFADGEYRESLELATQALSDAPDDVELLMLAGRAGLEEGADAIPHLRRASELAPDDAQAWRYLGEALAADGLTDEADAAFRKAVELDPDNSAALSHLGHTSLVVGRQDEGVAYLARAADSTTGASTAAISLVAMYRSFGQADKALAQARQLAEAVPEDAAAWLDVAELSLELNELDSAREAFETLRTIDDVPGHEVYPLHGLLKVAISGGDWDQARELASQAAALDPRSKEIGAFVNVQAGGESDPELSPPSHEEVDAALSASLGEHRQLHADDLRLSNEESNG